MYSWCRTNVECCEQKIKVFNEHRKKRQSYLVRYRLKQGTCVCLALQTTFIGHCIIFFQCTVTEIGVISYANPKHWFLMQRCQLRDLWCYWFITHIESFFLEFSGWTESTEFHKDSKWFHLNSFPQILPMGGVGPVLRRVSR